jgi:hypothetical protein
MRNIAITTTRPQYFGMPVSVCAFALLKGDVSVAAVDGSIPGPSTWSPPI